MDGLLCPIVVGHEAERAALQDAIAAAVAGSGRIVAVAGEAGVGKSRLLREAAAAAHGRGMTVLTGRALPRRSHVPLRALAEALQPLAGRTELLTDPRLGPFRGVITRVVRTDASDPSGPADAVVVGEAVVRLLSLLGEQGGGALVLEDLHWADPSTLDVLGYCADHLGQARALVLCSVRTGEDADREGQLRLLAERRAAVFLELPRLDAEQTDRMLRACLRSDDLPDDLRRFIRDRSEGVPLFVEELLAGLVASDALRRGDSGWHVVSRLAPRVPLSFAEAVHRRVQHLGARGRAVLEAAALLGRSFDADLLPAATGQDAAEVAETLHAAVASQLLAADDSGFSFRHALSREVVLSGLVPPLRAERAARVLRAVENARPGLPGEWVVLAADLAEQAGDRARAGRLLLEQAGRALTGGDVAGAALQLHRARLLVADDAALGVAVDEAEAQAAALAGEVQRAEELVARALPALARQRDGHRRQARLLAALARAAVAAGDWAAAEEHVARLRALVGDANDECDLRAEACALEAQVAIAVGDDDRARARAETAVELARHGAAPAWGCEGHEVLGRLLRARDVEAARRQFSDSLRIAQEHDLPLWRARALHELGTIDLYTTQDDSNLLAARTAAVEAGAAATLALVELHLASTALARWEPHRALAPAQRCAELSRRLSLSTLGMALLHVAVVHAETGDETQMQRLAAEAARCAPGDVDVEAGVPGRVWFHAAVRRGAFAEACHHLDDAAVILRAAPQRGFPFRGIWALLHEVVHRDGAAARAEARGQADSGMPFNATALELADAVALARDGDADEAARRVVTALAAWRRNSTMNVWAAVLLRLVGEAALADGWGAPQRWLAEAAATFDESGNDELASSCRAVLRRARAPVPRRGHAQVPTPLRALGVTDREMDVLRLVVAGRTNREIAARLHLSVRTVDRHVANLLAKTSVGDRRALARLALEVEAAGVPERQ